MLDFGLIRSVGLQAAARVGREAGGGQIQFAGRAVTAPARQGLVGDDLSSARQAVGRPFLSIADVLYADPCSSAHCIYGTANQEVEKLAESFLPNAR